MYRLQSFSAVWCSISSALNSRAPFSHQYSVYIHLPFSFVLGPLSAQSCSKEFFGCLGREQTRLTAELTDVLISIRRRIVCAE